MRSSMLCKSVWVTVVDQPKPCSVLDVITHLQITMMEALKLFVLLSSQKTIVSWRSCILMSSEIHHTQRCSREINMNKPLLAPDSESWVCKSCKYLLRTASTQCKPCACQCLFIQIKSLWFIKLELKATQLIIAHPAFTFTVESYYFDWLAVKDHQLFWQHTFWFFYFIAVF